MPDDGPVNLTERQPAGEGGGDGDGDSDGDSDNVILSYSPASWDLGSTYYIHAC